MKPGVSRTIKIGITLVILTLLLTRVKLATILAVLATANLAWLALALLLSSVMVVVRWLNWHLLVKAGLEQAIAHQTLASILGGMAIALITPARVGDLSRVAFLTSGRRAEASGLVLIDRFIDLCVVLLFGIVGVVVVFGYDKLPLLLIVLAFLLLGIFKLGFFLELGAKLIPIQKVKNVTTAASQGLRRLTLKALAINLTITILLNTIDLISLYILVRSLGINNFKAVTFVYPLVMLTNLVPITISGLGVRESASIALFAMFNIGQEIAFNATFLAYLINSLLPALVGIYFFRKLPKIG